MTIRKDAGEYKDMHIYINIYVYICICVYIYICVCIYIYIDLKTLITLGLFLNFLGMGFLQQGILGFIWRKSTTCSLAFEEKVQGTLLAT